MANASLQTVTHAAEAFQMLRGIFCVYKPANISCAAVRQTLIGNLCRDLNEMEVRPPTDFVSIEGSVSNGAQLTVKSCPSFADHPLIVGPRYQPEDFKMVHGIKLGKYTSGVLLMRVNGGYHKIKKLCDSNQLRTYELRGEFGKASDTHTPLSKIVEKATYRHITAAKLEQLLGSIQSSYQVQAFKYAGVPLNSQAAFEMAAKDTVRPADKSPPLVYNIRCVELDLPYFTLELSCIHETEDYLLQLVHEIGLHLRSCAICHRVRLIRYGLFNTDLALLRKHWTLEYILRNIEDCRQLVDQELLEPKSPHFIDLNEASRSSCSETDS
ncbi:pseudouridylate synthase TRUB2, mitochondrial isoform X1 [Rhipicephalus microplus]|uniref:pseudouridylate synthase TRUB2, mitochondrial isoform X1 n=2 Tax=Rhipicephalus microplus TaxID=6941 RepID=UPI003F6D82A8